LLSIIDKSKNKSQMKETFGNYIKELRIANNFTLTQLAAKLDLDSANLSKIENGKRDFDEKRLELLSKTFKIDFNTIKTKYFGEQIAIKLYEYDFSEEVLMVAEERIKYLRSVNVKQTNLEL
jgi:HTH-type transcriptional regulator, competence development regulator